MQALPRFKDRTDETFRIHVNALKKNKPSC